MWQAQTTGDLAISKATLLFHSKRLFDDGAILEMKLWWVSKPVAGSTHQLKYSLYYGREDEWLIGYGNERGKGDHRRHGGFEEPYLFTSPENLMADVLADVRRHRGDES